MKILPKLTSSVALAAAIATLSGCSMSSNDLPEEPTARIMAAKSAAQSAEDVAAGLVPTSEIDSRRQIPTGNLLPCSSGKQWSGNTTLQLKRQKDPTGLVDTISQRAEKNGFKVDRDTSRAGTPRATLTDAAGVSLLVGVWNDGTVLNIDSFSMCFSLPEGFSPRPSY